MSKFKYIKVEPIHIDFSYPRHSTALEITRHEPIYINPLHIALIQERVEWEEHEPRKFTNICMVGVNEPITIEMSIEKFKLLAEGARQEAMEVLYG